jgi:RNA polymerase sigma-70 factor (ECF subfamily)
LVEPGGAADAFDVIDGSDATKATDAREGFDARFAPVRDRLLRITGSLVGADEAEDVVQDTYLLGRARFGQLREHSAFEPWITRIAVNVCYSRHRRTKRLRQLLPMLLPRRHSASDVGLRELVEQLPPRERTVLVLHYGHGYGLDEVATILDLTHTNVRSIIARTRKRLFIAWRHAEGLDR